MAIEEGRDEDGVRDRTGNDEAGNVVPDNEDVFGKDEDASVVDGVEDADCCRLVICACCCLMSDFAAVLGHHSKQK